MLRRQSNLVPPTTPAGSRTYFVTARTAQGKALLQSERMATLFIDVLRSYRKDARFKVHEFVVMRNFVQLIMTVNAAASVEDVVHGIKGRFAFRATRELRIRDWIWGRDVHAALIPNRASFLKYKTTIEANPVKAGLAESAETYPYCSAYLRKNKAAAKTAGTQETP